MRGRILSVTGREAILRLLRAGEGRKEEEEFLLGEFVIVPVRLIQSFVSLSPLSLKQEGGAQRLIDQ